MKKSEKEQIRKEIIEIFIEIIDIYNKYYTKTL